MKRRTQFFLQANGKVVSDQMVTMRKTEVDQLVAEVNALREELKEANRLLHIWSPESAAARKEAQP